MRKYRKRLLIDKLEKPATTPKAMRERRAVELLERIGMREARRLLAALAGGAAEAELTREAKASLGLLEGLAATRH